MTVSTRSTSSPSTSRSTRGEGNPHTQTGGEAKNEGGGKGKRAAPTFTSETSSKAVKKVKKEAEDEVKPQTIDSTDKKEGTAEKVKDENEEGKAKEAEGEEKKKVTSRPEGYSKAHALPPKAFDISVNKRGYGTLEKGSIYFLYRPRVEFEEVHDIGEVARFHILLLPDSPNTKSEVTLFRNIIVGQKRMPRPSRHEVLWGEVVGVGDRLNALKETLGPRTYSTKTKGERHIGPARVAGKGHYILQCSQDVNEAKVPKGSKNMSGVYDTFLAYKLVLPHEMGEVQKELFIQEEGAYHLTVKERSARSNNPAVRDPPESRRPIVSSYVFLLILQTDYVVFHAVLKISSIPFYHKFIPANPPSLLNYGGAELLFIPSKHSVEEDVGLAVKEKELEEVDEEWKESEGDKQAVREVLKELGIGKEMAWTGGPLEGHWT